MSWFPRLSVSGRLTSEGPGKFRAQWDGDTEVFDDGVAVYRGGQPQTLTPGNDLTAGNGRLASGIPAQSIIFTNFLPAPLTNAALPALNADGEFFYVTNPQTNQKSLTWHNHGVISTGAIADLRASRQAAVWSDRGETWGARLPAGAPVKLQVSPAEFRPVPIDTPEGPWVLNHTQTGFILRPFGEFLGYRFDRPGQTFYPDAMFLDGGIKVVWTDDAGNLDWHQFTLTQHRVDLRVLESPPPPPPVPRPPVEPPVPEKVPPVPTAPNQLNLVRTVLRELTSVDPSQEGERGQITDEVVRRLGGLPWGRKDRDQNTTNNNNSDDALCYRLSDGRFEIYDILAGKAKGSPREDFATFSYAGTFADGENGFFREVTGTTPQGPGPQVPPPTNPARGGAQLDAIIASLSAALSALTQQLTELQAKVSTLGTSSPATQGSLNGLRIALKADNGRWVCADMAQGPDAPLLANRDDAGSWETFTIHVQ